MSLFHYFTMERFASEKSDKEAQDYQFHVLWRKDNDDLINELITLLQEIEDNTSTITKWFKICAEIKWLELQQENKDQTKKCKLSWI
jgi:hypothetical protein